ncbi:ring-cleaving dioxygenase [Desmospora activa]|uniref:Glyoxalase family protein n=1 Tax=Desmospora activa DSM 45169 TaxID=1121389 RepID=A0A2T4Z8T1_9BACL|nr:glyoxalase family protein [Desmospora activa DSM 45169]
MKKTVGIHHITAVAGHPQENLDFYTKVLGMRIIKQTVNFGDPNTYHLYFGDEVGRPGTLMTTFPSPQARKGRIGGGQVGVTSFAVPVGGLDYWKERLQQYDVSIMTGERLGDRLLQFDDPHGLHLEIVERKTEQRSGWTVVGLDGEYAITGIAGAVLYSTAPEKTNTLLEQGMGLIKVAEEKGWVRFQAESPNGQWIDVKREALPVGSMGAGVVHHIALRAADEAEQQEWIDHLHQYGITPTEVRNRLYFQSIYFREEGGILFEIATDGPGFTVDEERKHLGQSLKLPPWLEPERENIESGLLPLQVPKAKGGKG